MIKILFICHGNICRSTMAESVLTHMVATRGLTSQFEIDSAATSREEIGNPPHYGTCAKLAQVGIPVVPHRARQMTQSDYEYYDYLIGMDSANIRNMKRIAGVVVMWWWWVVEVAVMWSGVQGSEGTVKKFIKCFLLQIIRIISV